MPESALQTVLLVYISPDQILPLTSALGAVVGVVLIVWHQLVAFLRKGWQWVKSRLGIRGGALPGVGESTVDASQVRHALDAAGTPESREGGG
jgi:hypothetical protein